MDRFDRLSVAIQSMDKLAVMYRASGNRRIATRFFECAGELPNETAIRDAWFILDQASTLEDEQDVFLAQFRADMRPAIMDARNAIDAYERAVKP